MLEMRERKEGGTTSAAHEALTEASAPQRKRTKRHRVWRPRFILSNKSVDPIDGQPRERCAGNQQERIERNRSEQLELVAKCTVASLRRTMDPSNVPQASADASSTEGVAEAVASKYMNELTARLLSTASESSTLQNEIATQTSASPPTVTPSADVSAPNAVTASAPDAELDSTTAASLEKFMSTLKEHLQLDTDTWDMSGSAEDVFSSSLPAMLDDPSAVLASTSTGAAPFAHTSGFPLDRSSTLTEASASAADANASSDPEPIPLSVSVPVPVPVSPPSIPPVPRERVHSLSPAEHRQKIAQLVREHMHEEAHGPTKLGTGSTAPLMTKIKCLHASVAQKSYGSEKRFLCPPPVVHVQGTLRHAPSAPMLLMQVQGEDGDSFSGEQMTSLDDSGHARFTELHVTGTGKAKSFRLQLHLLAPRDDAAPIKRMRLGLGLSDTAAVRNASWACFDSAPIGIISKPSKRIAKARNVSAHITKDASVSLFNRINSQTYRTKYLCAQDGRLFAQSRSWTAFRLVVLSRRDASGPLDTSDVSVLTYGSVILLVDPTSGASTDPLIVCKVDRGRILPPIDGQHTSDDDDHHAWGAVAQMQKVALMRFVPTQGEWTLHAHTPRTYLCAGIPPNTYGDAGNSGGGNSSGISLGSGAGMARSDTSDDAHSLPLTFASTRPLPWTQHVVMDEAEDAFCWTLVGISHFEYAFMDVDMLGLHSPSASMGLALTPFPLVTTMPFYDAASHKLAMTVQHFLYVRNSAALQTPRDAYEAIHAESQSSQLEALEVWIGPLGPLTLASVPVPESDEAEVAVQLPPLREILQARLDPWKTPLSSCTLPILFVRAYDSTIYHSGRHVLCQDLVAVVRAAGDSSAANALQKLNVGLGEQAGAHELPPGSVWTLRVI